AVDQVDGGLLLGEVEGIFADGAALEVAQVFLKKFDAVADRDADDAPVMAFEKSLADHQSGEGAGRADSTEEIDPAAGAQLADQLVHAADVAPAAKGRRCADGEEIWPVTSLALGGHGLVDDRLLTR